MPRCVDAEQILRDAIGLDASTVGSSLIDRAVHRRMKKLGMRCAAEYTRLLGDGEPELQELIEQVVVPETYFFREPDALADVARRALETHARGEDSMFRVLSAPCSTGEEPYSIALSLLDAGVPAAAISIDAIDVSTEAVHRTAEAVYRPSSFRCDMSAWKQYFSESAEGWRIDESVRALVHPMRGNVLSAELETGHEQYDVIFCRNLLIYFDERAQARALEKLASLLAPNGVLVVGAADSFAARRAGFAPAVGHERSFLFRRRTDAAAAVQPVVARRAPVRAKPPRAAVLPLRKAIPLKRVSLAPKSEQSLALMCEGEPAASAIAEVSRLANEGQLEGAIDAGERAMRGGVVSAELLALVGTMYAAMTQLDRAESCYRKALFLEPVNEEALLHLALLVEKRGETALAGRLRIRARRALSFQPFAAR